MIGSKISVAVADAKGNKDVSDETAPVAVYEALEILDAEQKGAKTIEATFSEEITALDKLTVSKNGEELKQAYAPKIADDGLSATITLENRITAGTYTVTLTPADADEDPSSATFEGEVAALNSIEFVTDNLIMKDNEYKEGYAYIKGVDQFGDNMSLSSVTVIPGYGHFRSYDATTGKITIGVDDDETNFAIVKEVPVFVTYQNGADTIPANATLKVTTMSYVQDLTFGDIYKADGSKVDDDTNPLMIGDLKSKPYVEIKDVEDQYGNKLSAKDLNDQANGNTKVLFVIPDESTTSAYYSTGKFSTITEKDGTVKTILYLAAGGDMPGSMDLIITGASGQSFSKPVTVQDDPYIDTLRVNYPTLYEGTDESDALEFTAVDQYGKEIKDLFNFAPKVVGQDLRFNDMNHQTNKFTQITAPAGVDWIVKKDNINKKFTVTMKLKGDVKKGATLVMMATTAGLKVTPTNLTVGQRTNGESIDTTIGGSLNLDPMNRSFDFNKNIRFLSSNGTVMDRVENEQYPVFLKEATDDGAAGRNGAGEKTYDAVIAGVTNEKPAFFWTVSEGREGQVTGNATNGFVIAPTAGYPFDDNGKVFVDELEGAYDAAGHKHDANATITKAVLGQTVYTEHENATYYVTLYKASMDNANKLNVAVIDKQSFKLTYSPTIVDGQWQLGTKYTAKVKENRNLYADNKDTVTIQVTASPNIGEPYSVDAEFITATVNTDGFTVSKVTKDNGAKELQVKSSEAGTAKLGIYVQEPGDDQGVYTTVEVTADDAQTATSLRKQFVGDAVNGAALNSKVGAQIKDDSRTATEWTAYEVLNKTNSNGTDNAISSKIKVANGKMTIEGANRLDEELTLAILDQHKLEMTDGKFFIDGVDYETFWKNCGGAITTFDQATAAPRTLSGKHTIEVRSADDKIMAWNIITFNNAELYYTKAKDNNKSVSVANSTALVAAAGVANTEGTTTITLTRDVTLGAELQIASGVKVVVPSGIKLDYANGKDITIDAGGSLVIEEGGLLTTTDGKVTVDGNNDKTADTDGKDGYLTVDGNWDAKDIDNQGVINGSGHAEAKGGTVDHDGLIDVDGLTFVFADGSTLKGSGALAGHIAFSGTVDLTNAANLLLSGLTITMEPEAKLTKATKLVLESEAEITLEAASGSVITYTAPETGTTGTTVELSPEAVTGTGVTNTVEQKKMGTLEQTDTVFSTQDMKSSYGTDLELGAPTYEWDEDTKTANYYYKVTGTIKYATKLPGFGNGYHYGYAVKFPSMAETGAQIRYGAQLKEGTYEVNNGYMSEKNKDVDTWLNGWKVDDPAEIENKTLVVEYRFSDGAIVHHWIDLSKVTFEAQPANG